MADSRSPDRPAEVMANHAKGKTSPTPSLPTQGAHVPMRGESIQATKGRHVDGMAALADAGSKTRMPRQGADTWSGSAEDGSMDTRNPASVGKRMSPTAGTNTNKGA